MGAAVMADREALEAFCHREHSGLVRSLALYTGDPLLAEECAQEALLAACRNWSQVSELASPAGWLHRVGFNHANGYFRRRRAERRALLRRCDGGEPVYEMPDSATAIAVREALTRLPHRQRAALLLRYFSDLDVVETAQVLEITPEAVRSLTHRAIVAMRAHGHELADVVDEEVSGAG
ncbi:MAG TPA: sigma-70 family RNA polymerase sigma factor [Jiangellaceae bacterium]|nr:sigma-70 family RNA polymerase sigma factor [Jiangellaceae bacterium]